MIIIIYYGENSGLVNHEGGPSGEVPSDFTKSLNLETKVFSQLVKYILGKELFCILSSVYCVTWSSVHLRVFIPIAVHSELVDRYT